MAEKTKKSKKFRIARSGPTIDGRELDGKTLRDMAATYNPALYGARVFPEHIRGLAPEGPFPACGDVLSLEAVEEDGKVSLYGVIEANEHLLRFNAAGQKVYPSIEIVPNFAGTGKPYLFGLAVTDTPAAIGAERLTFSALPAGTPASSVYRSGENVALEFEGADDGGALAALAALGAMLESLFKRKPEPEPESTAPAPQPPQPPQPQQFNAEAIADAVVGRIEKPMTDAFKSMFDALKRGEDERAQLAARLETIERHNATTDGGNSHRPAAAGEPTGKLIY